MIKSKAWDWDKNEIDYWLVPTTEASFLAESWQSKGYSKFLDLGCGLGRHSMYFAKQGYEVSAIDLSESGINHLRSWAKEEQMEIQIEQGDMLKLPFPDETFHCIMAYNVIYHTDTKGFIKSLKEITRILKRNGELFITLNSKNSTAYDNADKYVRVDKNTILRDEHDTERNIPHFYVDIEDIKKYFSDYEFVKIPVEEIEYYDIHNTNKFSRHFKLLLRKK